MKRPNRNRHEKGRRVDNHGCHAFKPQGTKKSPAEKFLTRQAVLKNKPVRGRRHPGRGSRRTVSAGPCRSSRGWGIPTTDVSEPSIASRCWNAQSLDMSARQNGWARVGEGSGAVSAGPAQWVGWFPSGDHRQAWIDVEERSSGSSRSVCASSLWCSRTVVFWHDPPGDSRTPRTAIIDPSRSRHDPAWGWQSPAKSPLLKTSTQCVRPLGRTPSVPGRGPNGVGG